MIARFLKFLALGLSLVACAPAFSDGFGRTTAEGLFTDSASGKHVWSINADHALLWDSEPYTPIGAVFTSRFLSSEPTDENWQADIKALRALKKAGITNLLVRPSGGPGSLVELPPSTIQGMLDVLDSSGFTYGFDIEGVPANDWNAVLVNPSVYRVPAPDAGSTVKFRNVGGITSAQWFLVTAADGHIEAEGSADTSNGDTISVTLPQNAGGDESVLLIYPEARMSMNGSEDRRIPDVWTNADSYRDQILLYFNRVKFGKGLRFFLDPLKVDAALVSETDQGIIPTSDNFRVQFQGWLLKQYGNSLVKLRASWGVKNNDIPDIDTAARCRPLWFQSKGLPLLLDPLTGHTYEVLTNQSHLWQDIRQFQLESIQGAMNGVADAIKEGIADVPVLYSWSQMSPAFVNPGPDGFDGLLFANNGQDADLVQNGAGYAFSAVEQSRRTQWFIADLPVNMSVDTTPPSAPSSTTRTTSTPKTSNPPASLIPTADAAVNTGTAKGNYTRDKLAAESVGVKGEFVEPSTDIHDTSSDTSWTSWVAADVAARSVDSSTFSESKPGTIFYPINITLPGVAVRQIADNVWWLPTFQGGELLDLGSDLAGYMLMNSASVPTYVVWNVGTTAIPTRFRFAFGSNAAAQSPTGALIPFHNDKKVSSITFTSTPTLISGVADLPLPVDAAEIEFRKASAMIAATTDTKIPTESYNQRLYYIRNTILNKDDVDPKPGYDMVREIIAQLQSVMVPYVWLEGEGAVQQTFESIVASHDASGKAFLWVDTDRDPPGGTSATYHATYEFNANAPAEYAIWASIAPGVPGDPNVSSLLVKVDDQVPLDVTHPEIAGDKYGTLPFPGAAGSGAFTWCNLGSAQLTPGEHRITITLAGRASSTNRYTLGIDSLVLSRTPFTPNGAQKPTFTPIDINSLPTKPANGANRQPSGLVGQ